MEQKLLNLYNLSSVLTSAQSYSEVFNIFSLALQDFLNFDAFELLLIKNNELIVAKKYGLYDPQFRLLLDEDKGITVNCAKTKNTIYVPDVSKDVRYVEAAPDIKSELAIPLLYGEESIGVINIEKQEIDGFKDENIPLLEIFATVLAHALKNVEIKSQLEKSEKKYHSLVDNLRIGIYRNTPGEKGKFIEVNKALIDMFGYSSKDELLMLNVSDLYQQPTERKKLNKKLSSEGHIKNEELKLKKKNGDLIWALVTAVSVKDSDGSILYYDGFIEDITQQKQIEEQLSQAERNYQDIFENAVMGIYQSTIKGRHLSVNPALAKIYGYSSPEELIAGIDNIGSQLYVENKRRTEFIDELLKNNKISHFESRVYTKSGELIWISENATTVRDDQGNVKYFVGTVEDITELKKINQEADFYNALLRHDVANKLNLIYGYLDLLKDNLISADSQELVKLSSKSAETAIKIIENVRKLRVITENPDIETVDIDTIIHTIINQYKNLFKEKNIEVHYDDFGKSIKSTDSIREVIENVFRNAVLHSNANKIIISVCAIQGHIVITIEDNGIGISDKLKERIFEVGFKGKQSSGTGLGLYISKKIIESIGGKISIKDRYSKDTLNGTIFEIWLTQNLR